MGDKVSDKDLMKLYKARMKDRSQARTKRRRQLETSPKPMSDLLAQFFKHDGEALRRIDESRALMAWPGYVGESAARVSLALRVRNHTLTVYVEDPLWMQQLSLLKHEFLRRYREEYPKLQIRDIYFTRNKGERYVQPSIAAE